VTAAHFHKIFSVILQHGNVSKLKYLGTTPTNRNEVHDKIGKRIHFGNTCYYSIHQLLSCQCFRALTLRYACTCFV
jgi:hypothetical protein